MRSILFVLALAAAVLAANDSATAYDTVYTLNWKRCVMGFQFDTAIPRSAIKIAPDSDRAAGVLAGLAIVIK
jgi:hypothetical protein